MLERKQLTSNKSHQKVNFILVSSYIFKCRGHNICERSNIQWSSANFHFIFFADVKCNYTKKLIILTTFYYDGFLIHELNYAIDKWISVTRLEFL